MRQKGVCASRNLTEKPAQKKHEITTRSHIHTSISDPTYIYLWNSFKFTTSFNGLDGRALMCVDLQKQFVLLLMYCCEWLFWTEFIYCNVEIKNVWDSFVAIQKFFDRIQMWLKVYVFHGLKRADPKIHLTIKMNS